MERPDQHITETKSQRIFENIVPVEWVCREIKPDYGIDYLVEIFENNISTGKSFFVQLKGSTQEIKNDTFEKQITIDNLKYYSSQSLPVIIICVSVTTEKIWGILANKLIELKPLKDNQKTISLYLGKDYLLDKSAFRKIASQTKLLDKLGISSEVDSTLTENFNKHLLKWVENYFTDSVSVKFNNLPKHLNLIYKSLDDNSIQITLKTSNYSKTIRIENLDEEESFLYRPEFDSEEINDFNKETLLSIAIALAKHDIGGTLKLLIKLIGKLNFSNSKKWIELNPLGLLFLAKENNELGTFDKLVKEIIKAKEFGMFLFFDMAYFAIGIDEFQNYRIKNLKSVIASQADNEIRGTCHYNLGNILKTKSGKGIKHYFKAAKLFPNYKDRDYWWYEIAGLFFIKKHYKWAENSYKKSLSMSDKNVNERTYFRLEKVLPHEKNLVPALIADCLFFQGKFKEAKAYFEEYLISTQRKPQEWVLKNLVCLKLMKEELDNLAIDKNKSIQLCDTSITLKNNEDIVKKLNKAITLDPTNGLAWFNLGVVLDKLTKFDDAIFAFLVAGLIQEGDKEAQFNALFITITQQKHEMMQALLLYIVEKHGNLVINDLSDYVMNKNITLEAKRDLIKLFREMIETTIKMNNNIYNT